MQQFMEYMYKKSGSFAQLCLVTRKPHELRKCILVVKFAFHIPLHPLIETLFVSI
jgi:hypothetical protein